jgi:hypothetical protein
MLPNQMRRCCPFTELRRRARLVSWGWHENETGTFFLIFKSVPNQQICWCVQLISVHEISHETAMRLALVMHLVDPRHR